MAATKATETTPVVAAGFGPARQTESLAPQSKHPSSRARLYRLLWRWHFYAGLITAPILIVASVTGALYVFVHELQPVMYPELFVSQAAEGAGEVNRAPDPQLLDDAVAAVRQAYPTAQIVAAAEPRKPGRNAPVTLKLPEGFQAAMVDPSSDQVAGIFDEPNSFFGIVLAIHRRLLAGSVGRMFVELAAAWGIVLLVTGVYLWWPRRLGRPRPPVVGVWVPRWSGPFLPVLRDWHAVVGFYAVVTSAFVLFTGLFFTQVFGNAYKRISNLGGENPAGAFSVKPTSEPAVGRRPIALCQVVAAAEPLLPGTGPRRVQLPTSPQDTYRVTRIDWSNPAWKTTVFVDAYSGRVIHTTGWDDAPLTHRVRLSVYPIHTGEIFGLTTKILALLTCVALALLAVTGVWMWWRKRPRGTWGLPPSNAELPIPGLILAVIVGLGILLPAVGASILLIILGDAILSRSLGKRRRPAG